MKSNGQLPHKEETIAYFNHRVKRIQRLGEISPFYISPFTNESLTSWIYRLSNAHFCDFSTFFLGRINLSSLKSIDFDCNNDPLLREEIIRNTPLIKDQLNNLTLFGGVNQMFFQKLFDKRFVPWLFPRIRSANNPNQFGLQFCPSCWSKDMIVHHRISWRLSLYFFCENCFCYLQNSCPECNYPIVYSHPDFECFDSHTLDHFRFCFKCQFDLSKTVFSSLSSDDLITAKRINIILNNNEKLPCTLEEYLIVLHYFTQREFAEFNRVSNFPYPGLYKDRSYFLEIKSTIRAQLILQAFNLMDGFPDNMKDKKQYLKLRTYSFWIRGFKNPPKWYLNQISCLK